MSDYCDVGGNTAIGNRCIIGHGAEMSGVMMDKVYLYHYCEMSGVFGCATDIGAATVCGTLRFDDKDTAHNIKGRYEVPPYGANATYMGDRAIVSMPLSCPAVKSVPTAWSDQGLFYTKMCPAKRWFWQSRN